MGGGMFWKDAKWLKIKRDWLIDLTSDIQDVRKSLPKNSKWDMEKPIDIHWLVRDLKRFMEENGEVQAFFKEARLFGRIKSASERWDKICDILLAECMYLSQHINDEATRTSMTEWVQKIIDWKNSAKVTS